jgi:hypothetical protein
MAQNATLLENRLHFVQKMLARFGVIGNQPLPRLSRSEHTVPLTDSDNRTTANQQSSHYEWP